MLSDESLWVPHYIQSHEAPVINNFLVGKVPTVYIPNTLTNRFLRCCVTSNSAKDTWYLAGNLALILNKGIVPDFEARRFTIGLNRFVLIQVPDYIYSYQLKFEAVYWLNDIMISIDKFIGEISLPSQKFQSASSDTDLTMFL